MSTSAPIVQRRYWRCVVQNTVFLALAIALPALAQVVPNQPTAADANYDSALVAYQQNDFTTARKLFLGVKGAKESEARAYIGKIDSYRDLASRAMAFIERGPNEQDATSLSSAISDLQEAIRIKPDGPGHLQQKIEKAQQLLTQMSGGTDGQQPEKYHDWCQKALQAAHKGKYETAASYSCALDELAKGAACGNSTAAALCEQMRVLAYSHPGKTGGGSGGGDSPALPTEQRSPLEEAKAAFSRNDFARALSLISQIHDDKNPEVLRISQAIHDYQRAFEAGEAAQREGKYDDARAAFRQATGIKREGPGLPASRLALVDLEQGIDEFFSGQYQQAEPLLSSSRSLEGRNGAAAHFFLGACMLARFLLDEGHNAELRQIALKEFQFAKSRNYRPETSDVSPKIMQVYEQLGH